MMLTPGAHDLPRLLRRGGSLRLREDHADEVRARRGGGRRVLLPPHAAHLHQHIPLHDWKGGTAADPRPLPRAPH